MSFAGEEAHLNCSRERAHKERGSRSAPPKNAFDELLEDELQSELHGPSIAVEGRLRIQEVRLSWRQVVFDRRSSLTEGTNVIQNTRRELRMIENVERLCLEF